MITMRSLMRGNFIFRKIESVPIRLTHTRSLPRLQVVMDIDECMIHTVDMAGYYRQNEDRKEGVSRIIEGIDSHVLKCEDGVEAIVHHRPGLLDYLRMISEFTDVYAFTAAMPVYARPLIKHLDPDQSIFKNVWYRESCTKIKIPEGEFYTKDLAKAMGEVFNDKRTILVDNNILSFIPQPMNGIPVPCFYDNPNDFVLATVHSVLQTLDNESDVKPLLHQAYRVRTRIDSIPEIRELWQQSQ